MFVFLFHCIYTNPATGCYMNKTILCITGEYKFAIPRLGTAQLKKTSTFSIHFYNACASTLGGALPPPLPRKLRLWHYGQLMGGMLHLVVGYAAQSFRHSIT